MATTSVTGGLSGVAFITGATGGIGHATSLAFAKAGVRALVLTDIQSTAVALEALATACRAVATNHAFDVSAAILDVTVEADVKRVLEEVQTKYGRIDYCANIAGVSEYGAWPIADCPTDSFDAVMSVNVRGLFLLLKYQAGLMRTQEPVVANPSRPGVRGSIVNMASIAGHTVIAPLPSYGTSKHAIIGLTRYAAAAHAADGIRVNSVSPGFVDTALTRRLPPPVVEALEAAPAQKRLGSPDEVADVIVFLSGSQASWVTGEDWKLDGGLVNLKV